jgi:hypothetical protein
VEVRVLSWAPPTPKPSADLRGALKKRMGVSIKTMFIPPEAHVPHGFRVSASTLLNELGFDSALIELQLWHAKRDQVAGIYDRSQRVAETQGDDAALVRLH